MKKYLSIILVLVVLSCREQRSNSCEDFSISISDQYYNYDLKTGIFKIDAINFIDTIKLNANQKDKIFKAFYKFNIDSISGKKSIFSKKHSFPDFGDTIKINFKDIEKSSIYISGQVLNKMELDNVGTDVYEFKNNIFVVLKTNQDYKKCIDYLEANYKNLPKSL